MGMSLALLSHSVMGRSARQAPWHVHAMGRQLMLLGYIRGAGCFFARQRHPSSAWQERTLSLSGQNSFRVADRASACVCMCKA